jgi:predicted DNA-binding transcriptional regulator AlpA
MTGRLPYPPPFQDLATLAEHICAGESTIENWVKMGMFPKPRMQGGKRLWRWKDVERHLADEAEQVTTAPSEQAERITNATRKALQRA